LSGRARSGCQERFHARDERKGGDRGIVRPFGTGDDYCVALLQFRQRQLRHPFEYLLEIAASGAFGETTTCGASIAANASCTVSVTFTPTASGTQTGSLTITSNATNSPSTVSLTGTGAGSTTTNLALNAPVTASSYTQTYAPANAVDGNTSTYWEADNGVWPSWITVNLGSSQTLGSVTITLPPSSAWNTRTQTLSILGSTNDSTFTTIVGSATYTWNPSTGNTVTIPLPSGTSDQYVEFSFTANSVQNGAQASEIEIYG